MDIYGIKKSVLNMLLCITVSICIITLTGCSSVPKRSMKTTTISDLAYSNLEMGNNLLFQGNELLAKQFVDTAYRQALSVDDVRLLSRICLAKSKLLARDPALSAKDIAQAISFAQESKDTSLITLCMLYNAQNLIVLTAHENSSDMEPVYKALEIAQEAVSLSKKSAYNRAFAYRIAGEAYIKLAQWKEAETALKEAAKIHTKERYLDEIGLDWYLLAQAYSLGGVFAEAEKALQTAILYDRDAENTLGLIADYRALHTVSAKLNRMAESQEALARSEAIARTNAGKIEK